MYLYFFKENLFLNKVQEEPDGSRGCIKEPLHNTTNVQSVYFWNQSWSPYGTDKPEQLRFDRKNDKTK